MPGTPQEKCINSLADITFYGGSAGGMKTDTLIGCAITQHQTSIIFRRQFPQLMGIRQRCDELLEDYGRFNSAKELWRLKDGRRLEFGAMDKIDDWKKYQGRPHDFIGFDEICHFAKVQFVSVIAWARVASASTQTAQRVRIICGGNPPTDAEGDWVIDFWAPWLDENHPNPAEDGELRWFATINGKDIERTDGTPFEHVDERTGKVEQIKPKSRTFIRSRVTDNPFLMATDYVATLQGLEEPMRSQMLYGDFSIGQKDDIHQVIPTAWVKAAQLRWKEGGDRDPETGERFHMDAIGADIARGGKDHTVLTPRHANWFGRQKIYPGKETPDGPEVVRLLTEMIPGGHTPEVKIDISAVGSSPFDFAKQRKLDAYAMVGNAGSTARDRSRKLKFHNMRAQWWWQLREALDPDFGDNLAIPPDRVLLADLTAPHYEERLAKIQIESKEDVAERIGRSTDRGDSLVYAHGQPKRASKLAPQTTGISPVIALYAR